jgi:hypothetical protein
MSPKFRFLIFVFLLPIIFSCESKQAEQERLDRDQRAQYKLEEKETLERKEAILRVEQQQREQEKQDAAQQLDRDAQLDAERKAQENYNLYISNSLNTGAIPYASYYGNNPQCDEYGCSQIKVLTSSLDVIVMIKSNEKVVRHAYIQAGDNYTLSFPNGTYQVFFYYGRGWNPEKEMKNGAIKGGFISNENFGKDDPQTLYNKVLSYELILQQNGNFSTQPSNPDEAL